MKFYMYIECSECGKDIFSGVNTALSTHKGLPVIPFDMAALSQFDCDECEVSMHVGEYVDIVTERWEQ